MAQPPDFKVKGTVTGRIRPRKPPLQTANPNFNPNSIFRFNANTTQFGTMLHEALAGYERQPYANLTAAFNYCIKRYGQGQSTSLKYTVTNLLKGGLVGTRTYHDHEYVKVAIAAKAVGKPYQYIYGMAERNWAASTKGKKTNISARVVIDKYGTIDHKTGKPKTYFEVCKQCCIDFYGSAVSREPTLLTTPLIGFRTWFIQGNQLMSWHDSDFPWLPTGSTAKCNKNSHQVPGDRCSCGLYALKEPNRSMYHGDVIGAVGLWGRYRSGDRGHRAEHGKPVALLCEDWTKADMIHHVAGLYHIPVTHNIIQLQETDWYRLAVEAAQQLRAAKDPSAPAIDLTNPFIIAKGGVADGHRQGDGGGRGSSLAGHGGGYSGDGPGRAPCRVTTTTPGRTGDDLKRLYQAGEISLSNMVEWLESPPDEIDWNIADLDTDGL